MKDFKAHTHLETTTIQEGHTLQPIEATKEGFQDDKANINYPTIIPTIILPKHKRQKQHRRDIIRATGYCISHRGALVADTIYKGRRCLQLIECKYSAHSNISDIIDHTHILYAPLKQAIQLHNNGRLQLEVIPIVISRTCNFHTRTLAEIAQLVSFKKNHHTP